jgi:hypothetical protein
VRKRKTLESFVMELGQHATTLAHHEAIWVLLEMSRDERTRIERSNRSSGSQFKSEALAMRPESGRAARGDGRST